MKGGDVSLILKKVSIDDAGEYECHVSLKNTTRKRAYSDLWCVVNLTVVVPQQIITNPGDNVTLPCQGSRNISIAAVQWIRPELHDPVYLHRNEPVMEPHDQEVRFVKRVKLKDRQMKDGDMSLVLMNVQASDTGTYECHRKWRVVRQQKRTLLKSEPISIVKLIVTDQQITVRTGDDVTLQCLDPRGGHIELLEWRRQDLVENVFVWKQGKMFEDPQHPFFKNRTELRNPEMKDGDVSVILKNVNINDTGTYECRVRNSSTKPPQLLNTTKLTINSDQQQITVKTGDNVTLQCHHRGGDIQLLEWRRLNPEEDVFVCRHGKNDCSTPHPSFKNRVELRDPEMKDRDVSVILNNVTINDTGTYECRVRNSSTKPPQLLNTTRLTVTTLDQQQNTVKTGDNVTLQCLDHRGGDIELLEWRRQNLKEAAFVWKHGKMSDDNQHPSFKNRVELRDPEMKDGDVSVILKNVTIKDTGTYECYVRNSNTKPPQLLNTTKLTVTALGE
ncbi:hypothetical protein Q8A73_012515 [Channa argus]|nr:hypothetical protein Q8A73_012515 [Channa argus]